MRRMSSNLTKKDYISILNYYNISIPKTRYLLKKKAENILGEKLCRCIKKVGEEPRSIGICTKAVFKNKGLSRGKFTCKKKLHADVKKMPIKKILKTKKNRKSQRGGNDIEEGVVTKVPRISTFDILDKIPYGQDTIVPLQKEKSMSNVDVEMGLINNPQFSELSGTDYGEFVDPFEGGKQRKTRKSRK
jgi:hypothetical protein